MAKNIRKPSKRSRKPQSTGQGKSMENTELHELFLDDLADVYNAENQLLKALPKMAKAAQSEELRDAFENHLKETRGQIKRIEQAVRVLGESLKRKKCKGMEGLLE